MDYAQATHAITLLILRERNAIGVAENGTSRIFYGRPIVSRRALRLGALVAAEIEPAANKSVDTVGFRAVSEEVKRELSQQAQELARLSTRLPSSVAETQKSAIERELQVNVEELAARGERCDSSARSLPHHGDDSGRVGHRQGAGGARSAQLRPGAQGPLCHLQLLQFGREPGRIPALRPRARRLHRRPRRGPGLLSRRPRRHAVPRRGRRAAAQASG